MPIYEFRCLDCENEFEALVFKSSGKICCPQCDGEKLERLISACGFKSKGEESIDSSGSSSSACASCSGGNCSTCH